MCFLTILFCLLSTSYANNTPNEIETPLTNIQHEKHVKFVFDIPLDVQQKKEIEITLNSLLKDWSYCDYLKNIVRKAKTYPGAQQPPYVMFYLNDIKVDSLNYSKADLELLLKHLKRAEQIVEKTKKQNELGYNFYQKNKETINTIIKNKEILFECCQKYRSVMSEFDYIMAYLRNSEEINKLNEELEKFAQDNFCISKENLFKQLKNRTSNSLFIISFKRKCEILQNVFKDICNNQRLADNKIILEEIYQNFTYQVNNMNVLIDYIDKANKIIKKLRVFC